MRHAILMLVALLGLTILPSPAHAFEWLSCDDEGNVKKSTGLFDTARTPAADPEWGEGGGGGDWGDPFPEDPNPGPSQPGAIGKGACDYKGLEHVFSQVLCDFLRVLNSILGLMYCTLQHVLERTMTILMSVYVAVFGWQVLMGTAQLNSRDVVIRLIKMAVVFMFAVESTWGINIIFKGAVSFISDVSFWIVNAIPGLLDLDVTGEHCGSIQFQDRGNVMPLFLFFDCLIKYTFLGAGKYASIRVIGLFGAMMFVYPPLFFIAFQWASKTFLTMVRAVINFLMALAAIAFLVTLTPIFMSFMLFQVTTHFFENWLRYLISYVIQVTLVFAVIVMWVMVFFQFTIFFKDLSNVVFPFKPALEQAGTLKPAQSWGICPPLYGKDDNGAPTIQCRKINGLPFNPYSLLGPSPDPNNAMELNPTWALHNSMVVPPSRIINESEFLYYVFYHFIGLLIVTYAFGTILEHIPRIAQSISSPAPLPQILGGMGTTPWGTAGGGGLGGNNIRGDVGSVTRNASAAASASTGKR